MSAAMTNMREVPRAGDHSKGVVRATVRARNPTAQDHGRSQGVGEARRAVAVAPGPLAALPPVSGRTVLVVAIIAAAAVAGLALLGGKRGAGEGEGVSTVQHEGDAGPGHHSLDVTEDAAPSPATGSEGGYKMPQAQGLDETEAQRRLAEMAKKAEAALPPALAVEHQDLSPEERRVRHRAATAAMAVFQEEDGGDEEGKSSVRDRAAAAALQAYYLDGDDEEEGMVVVDLATEMALAAEKAERLLKRKAEKAALERVGIDTDMALAAEKAEKLLRKKADAPGKGRARDVKAVRDVAAAAVG